MGKKPGKPKKMEEIGKKSRKNGEIWKEIERDFFKIEKIGKIENKFRKPGKSKKFKKNSKKFRKKKKK